MDPPSLSPARPPVRLDDDLHETIPGAVVQ